MYNPNPSEGDIELPMPCGVKLVLRHVCIPAEGFFGDLRLDLGCEECGRQGQGFMEGRRKAAVSGPFTLEDLPDDWHVLLTRIADKGDGRCPDPREASTKGFYYFIGKYEISNFQWNAVMEGECPGPEGDLRPDDARPKTGISWFEAVDFTRRYTEWLLTLSPESLPRFSGGRFAYIRLPTEAEWEYAARGGHQVSELELNHEEFFPLNDRTYGAYAVFTEPGSAKPPERLAWIGSKCPNPLDLYDTAGNASEMVLDPFRFSLGFRLHGATGGFIVKGGSYRKRKAEIMPGRREEMPFFLKDGAFRSRDLGFRVVLSAIVTPRSRTDVLNQEWVLTNLMTDEEFSSPRSPEGESQGIPVRKQGVEPNENAGIKTGTTEEMVKYFPGENDGEFSLEDRQKEIDAIRSNVRSALFTAESVMSYSMRRQVMLYELGRLQYMKTKIVPESVLEALEGDVSKAKEAVLLVDRKIGQLIRFYIHRVRETGSHPQGVLLGQMSLLSRELMLEEGFSQSIKSRFDLFRIFQKHVAMYLEQPESITQDVVLRDIVPSIQMKSAAPKRTHDKKYAEETSVSDSEY
jgi:formylglycine-generating enzyme required for sulfatase activity